MDNIELEIQKLRKQIDAVNKKAAELEYVKSHSRAILEQLSEKLFDVYDVESLDEAEELLKVSEEKLTKGIQQATERLAQND